jgi:DNA-binding CsgD family transcriptional regulator
MELFTPKDMIAAAGMSRQDRESRSWSELVGAIERQFGPAMVWFGFTHAAPLLKLRGVQAVVHMREHVSPVLPMAQSREPLAVFDLAIRGAGVGTSPQFFGSEGSGARASGAVIWRRFGGRGLAFLAIVDGEPESAGFAEKWWNAPQDFRSALARACLTLKNDMVGNRFRLTPRQQEVLGLVAAGLGAKAIARELNIAPKTVFNTMDRAREALEAGSTSEAIAKACIYNLL